jgi:ferredoxin--NADP+ reductase
VEDRERVPIPWSEKYDLCEIVERRDFAADLWAIRIRPPSPFSFRAGQYATLGVDLGGRVLERPYSIVSAPEEPLLEFFIERIPNGALTPHLFPLQVGDTLLMRKRPKGLFMRQGLERNKLHLFVATVTGVAPFASMLRHLEMGAHEEEPPRAVLLQGASLSSEFGYLEELSSLAARSAWFDYVPTVSRPWADPAWAGETGRAEDVLRKYSDSFQLSPGTGMVYLCGHPGMIAGARSIMTRRGLQDAEIMEEQYWPEGKEPSGEG